MLKRSHEAICIDWYRLISKELIRLIESTADTDQDSVTEQQVAEAIYLLSINSQALRISPPCAIQFWEGTTSPNDKDFKRDENWKTPILINLGRDEGLEHPATVFSSHNGPRRLWIDSKYYETNNLAIDEIGPEWFHLDKHGAGVKEIITAHLSRSEVQTPSHELQQAEELQPFNIEKAILELIELDNRIGEWIEDLESKQIREFVGDQVELLWNILNLGNLEFLDIDPNVRHYLREVWSSLQWVQRWVELGISGIDRSVEKKFARSLVSPTSFNFVELVTREKSLIKNIKIVEGEIQAKTSKRGKTANQLIMSKLLDNQSLCKLTAKQWASLINKSPTTIKETKAWQYCKALRKDDAVDRRERDSAYDRAYVEGNDVFER